MTYYPVGIPTLCRYEHFKRCVESLARNTHADKTELVIGLDYPPSDKYREGYEKISKYVDTITGFAKVTVFRHQKNLGAIENWLFIQNYIFEDNDAAIMTEDDNVFSPCFLDYMNKSLQVYSVEDKVVSVSAFSPLGREKQKSKIYFTHTESAYGLGFWRDKSRIRLSMQDCKNILENPISAMKIFINAPLVFGYFLSMVRGNHDWGDVKYSIYNILNECYQLCPTYPLVLNRGLDGSGLHSGCNHKLLKAYEDRGISNSEFFELTYCEPKLNKFIKKTAFWNTGYKGSFSVMPQFITFLIYIKYLLLKR